MSWSVGTVYTRTCFWKKGNRVSNVGDSLTIKIGGSPDDKKKIKHSNKIKSTKYSLITFLPQNLLEQFRRIANFYFLIMTIIAIIIDSPVTPLTSLAPLVFVIAVTATKQGYEDFLRHKADNMVNYSLVTVIRNGIDLDIRCEDILQGDLVKVPRDCDVPCDLILLKSSEMNGKCFITTANLDGETNLKTLVTPKGLPSVEINKLHTLGIIECELPQTDLYTFNGRIELSSIITRTLVDPETNQPLNSVLPLMAENLMLRGSRVKNTECAIGCAVYTGQSTKLALNSKITRNKQSSSEKFINKFLVFFLVLLIIIVTCSYFIKRYNDLYLSEHNYYLGEPVDSFQVSEFLQNYFSFLIIFNYLIPISLYVTIEMHKFLGSLFMEWDPDLFDSETNQPCIVNTSDLNEELGQIRLLFSDKTGTLTKNEMIFQQCSINGKMYIHKGTGLQDMITLKKLKIHEFKDDIFNFVEALALCHTVQVAGKQPDEEEDEEEVDNDEMGDRFSATIYDFKNIREEDNSDSDPEDLKFITLGGRPSNTSNSSRPISLSDFERMANKNNLTRRNVDLNPLLINNFGDNNINDNNITGRKNINELQEISSVRSFDLHKRPYSEQSGIDSRMNSRPHSAIIQSSVNIDKPDETDMPKFNIFKYPVGLNELKRTISANPPPTPNPIKTHRRTQSATTNFVKASNLSRPISRQVSFLRQERITSTREYYAAPSYNEASLVERKQSVMRHGVIKSVIDHLDYQASSPDEKALVEACAKLGFVYTGDDEEVLTIKLKKSFYKNSKMGFDTVDDALNKFKSDNTNKIKCKRLAVLEFTSDRKRMSVIVKDRKGKIWLYTKGAESHVLPLCNKTTSQLIEVTQKHVNEFARQGLRTLAVARKHLTSIEYNDYESELLQANNSLANRKHLVEECQRKIETNLELLGATAVEDALQDNVRDTLESLRAAGIKVWVLTGDKVETALNIALACGHIPENAYKYFITECKNEEEINRHLDAFNCELQGNPDGIFTLLIDGSSLTIALRCCAEKFRDITIKCRAVLCCRLSPLQKCEVVQLMKTVAEKPITAAIGDGANDVSMIQEAHVGLGIVGKEGRQAARCADYAFANFSMVKKILLVHGHYYSHRLALLVLYFFYKNLVFMFIQFCFQSDSLFSSQSVYDSIYLTLYNVAYTALPILFISLTEKVYPEEKLLRNPELYKEISKNKQFSWRYFVGWMLIGVYHGCIIYYFTKIIWLNNSVIFTTPYTASLPCYGTVMIHNVVLVVNLKLWMEAVYQSYMFIATIWFSIFSFMATTVVYNFFNFNYDGDMLNVYNNLLSSLTFWILSLVILIAALTPDFTIKICRNLNINVGPIFPGVDGKKLKEKQLNSETLQSTYL